MVDNMLTLCLATTATTVPLVSEARAEENTGRSVDGDKTELSLVHFKQYNMEVNVRQKNLSLCFYQKI